jgi:hypothetical protein
MQDYDQPADESWSDPDMCGICGGPIVPYRQAQRFVLTECGPICTDCARHEIPRAFAEDIRGECRREIPAAGRAATDEKHWK